MKKKKGRIAAAARVAPLLCVAIAAAGGCGETKAPEPVVRVQTAVARRMPIARIVEAEGVLYPLHEADLTPKVSAPVEKFYVNRGSRVRKGQLLATLQNSDMAAAALENRGAYQQAEANYQTAIAAGVPEQMQKARADAVQAKQAYEAAEQLYKSRENLYRQGAIARKELDQARVAATEAKGNYELAQRHLEALEAGGEKRQIAAAEGELTAAKGRYMGAEAQLNYTQIRSPIDGVVTDRLLYPGAVAPADRPLITVMDLSHVIARLHVAQGEAALLKVGDPATIRAPGVAQIVAARVSMVNPAVEANSTTVEVWVEAPNPHDELRPGSAVTVAITSERIADAVVIPARALLQEEGGAPSVMVAGSDGKAHAAEVKAGIREGDLVQIVAGLAPGTQVITEGGYGLPDGTRIEVENPAAPGTARRPKAASPGAKDEE